MNRAGQDAPRAGRNEPRVERVALLLCAVAVAGLTLVRAAVSALALGGLAAILMQALGLVLFALVPSVLGLLVLSGDQTDVVRFKTLGTAQITLYAATGVLAVFPAALLGGVSQNLLQSFVTAVSSAIRALTAPHALEAMRLPAAVFAGCASDTAARLAGLVPGMASAVAAGGAAAELSASLFLPMLLCHALLAPVGEELFFRGYLLGSFEGRAGRRKAALAVALLFALAHGLGGMTPVYLLLGLLFALLTLRADSVLAPMLAHACYNAALVALQFLGAGALLDVGTLPGCAVLLLGSAAFVGVLHRALALRPGVKRARVWDGHGLSRRELTLLAGTGVALLASLIVGGLLG